MDITGDKRIQRNSDNWSELEFTEDLAFDIFTRLPVTDLCTCKCVSKRWRKWMRHPDFVKLQLSFAKEYPIYIVLPYIDSNMVLLLMNAEGEFFDEIIIPGLEEISYPNMICSYNGLICCTNDANNSTSIVDMDVYICNPATRDVFRLPKCCATEEEPLFGVAFGPAVDEYKVFRFFKSASESERIVHMCEIYSSITGSWRGIGIVSHCPMGSNHAFLNGKVYWFIGSEEDPSIPSSILSVDMEENFRMIGLPDNATEYSFLVDLEGNLSVIILDPTNRHLVDIWVLLNFNDSTWVKKCSINIPIPDDERIDSIAVREGDICFGTTEHYLIYNLGNRSWKDIEDDICGSFLTLTFPYIKTLVPCNGGLEP